MAGWGAYTVASSFAGALGAELLLAVSLSFISGSDSALLYETLRSGGAEASYARHQGRMSGFAQTGEAAGALYDPREAHAILINYELGMQQYQKGNHNQATAIFQGVKRRFPYSKWAILAELRIADCNFAREQYMEAVDAYKLFIKFRDLTSGKETYPPSRYMYTEPVKDGKVIVDFNYSYSPPCAFTEYATCIFAPPQNHLPFRVEAGEIYKT